MPKVSLLYVFDQRVLLIFHFSQLSGMFLAQKQHTCLQRLFLMSKNSGIIPFLNQKFKDFQRFSRTHFPFFKDSTQCKKEPWVYFLALPQHEQFYPKGLSLFVLVGTWESGLDKVSTEFKDFQGLEGLSRTSKVRVNPDDILLLILNTKAKYHFMVLTQ